VAGGYPVVWGTRTPVRLLVEAYRETGDVERTSRLFRHLSRDQVRGALDYYAKYPARVDEDFERYARVLLELHREQ